MSCGLIYGRGGSEEDETSLSEENCRTENLKIAAVSFEICFCLFIYFLLYFKASIWASGHSNAAKLFFL